MFPPGVSSLFPRLGVKQKQKQKKTLEINLISFKDMQTAGVTFV